MARYASVSMAKIIAWMMPTKSSMPRKTKRTNGAIPSIVESSSQSPNFFSTCPDTIYQELTAIGIDINTLDSFQRLSQHSHFGEELLHGVFAVSWFGVLSYR